MSQNGQNEQLLKISSKYILKEIISYLKYNYFLKLIKYNKKLQNYFLDIIFEESIFNNQYYIKTKKDIIS